MGTLNGGNMGSNQLVLAGFPATRQRQGYRVGRHVYLQAGDRFGFLVVIKRYGRLYNQDAYLCHCDCGNDKRVIGSNLRSGHTISCGCKNKGIYHGGDMPRGLHSLLIKYREGARARNLHFELTDEQATALFAGVCYYCGVPPALKVVRGHPYPYNGIDRLDSSQGYVLDNCVSCCKRCNFLKGARALDEFLDQIAAIAAHRLGMTHDHQTV